MSHCTQNDSLTEHLRFLSIEYNFKQEVIDKVSDKSLASYRAALEEKFPALLVNTLEYLSEGWDSVACVVNDKWLFRFPKRQSVAERLINIEVPLLATLAPHLPLPVPHFEYVALEAGHAYPWPFAGYLFLPGEQLDNCPPAVIQAEWWKPNLAAFLAALHRFSTIAAQQLGVQPLLMIDEASLKNAFQPGNSITAARWRTALEDFYTVTRHQIYPHLSDYQQDVMAEAFEDFLDNDRFFEFTPTLIHGDFSPEQVLLDPRNQRVSGIIDFGDVAFGDPAYDLWENLLPYYPHQTDPTFAERCHFYKKLSPLQALLFGQQMSDPALIEYGLYELKRLWFQ